MVRGGVRGEGAAGLGVGVVAAGCSIGAALLLCSHVGVRPISAGLDPSYVYALNVAAVKGLRWGEEFVSTYGPYGFLLKTMDVGNHVEYRLAFTLVLGVGIGAAVAMYVGSFASLGWKQRVLLIATMIYAVSIQEEDEYRALCVLVLLLLTGVSSGGSLGYFVTAGAITGAYLMIKFSLGFGALVPLGVSCVLARRPAEAARRLLAASSAAGAAFVAGWAVYSGGVERIGSYFWSAWEVTGGYPSAMSLSPRFGSIGAASFVAYGALLVAVTLGQSDQRLRREMVVLAWPLFVAWKHSVVRQDGHVIHGMMFGLFVLDIMLVNSVASSRAVRSLGVAAVGVILLTIPWFNPLTGGADPMGRLIERVQRAASLRGLESLLVLRDIAGYRERLARVSQESLKAVVLSDQVRRRIGNSSIDIYPWEISYAHANKLNWVNRPMPASFNAYTPALDRLNAMFFKSDRKPEYVLWHHDAGMNSIDGRYLFFDEPETLRTLLSYYDFVESTGNVTLMRARSASGLTEPENVGAVTASWGTWLDVPETAGVVLARARVNPSLATRVVRGLFREDAVTLAVRFGSREEMAFRVVPDNMVSGLWLNPFPVTVADFRSLLDGRPTREVRAIRFDGGPVSEAWSRVEISWSRIRAVNRGRDELRVAEVPALRTVDRGCAGAIDGAVVARDWFGRRHLEASGWARDGDLPIKANALWLTDEFGRPLATEVEKGPPRPDVARHLGARALEWSGWRARAHVGTQVGTTVGFIVRTRSGRFLASCNRIGVP